MMDSKITVTIMAVALIAFGLVAATTFASPDDASAQKSCKAKKWSHCKGDKGWYTEHGHHHCYKGEDDCENYKKK
jgi:hypothetical protein